MPRSNRSQQAGKPFPENRFGRAAGQGVEGPELQPASSLGAGDLAGASMVISAGGTREPIDAVRFISNASSGKMGFSLAAEAA